MQYERFTEVKGGITIHTRAIDFETMFPNMKSCPALSGLRERIVKSNEFQNIISKYNPLREWLKVALNLKEIPVRKSAFANSSLIPLFSMI